MTMDRIALVGAGSIGIITGALITQQGRDVTLFDANEPNVRALQEHGARITGTLEEVVPVTAKLPGEAEGRFDLVILITKQVFTEPAVEPFLPLLADDGVVLTLQNGTPEDKVAEIVGRERTLAGNIMFAAIWQEPGVSMLAHSLDYVRSHAFDVGELDGSSTDRVREVAEILSAVGHCTVSDNITGTTWSKLLTNATFSGLSAALGVTFGEVIDDPVSLRAAVHLMDETVRAGQAHGIAVTDWEGWPVERLRSDGGVTVEERMAKFVDYVGTMRAGTASMLQDMQKGIPCEKDYIPGRVIEVAEQHGVETPYTRLVHRLIAQAEEAGVLPDREAGRAELAGLMRERGEG